MAEARVDRLAGSRKDRRNLRRDRGAFDDYHRGRVASQAGVGRKVSGDAIAILDEMDQTCAPGEVGEIFFAAETTERFRYIGAEPRIDGKGRMSLGDLGYVDEDDYLFLSDRRTDLIIRGGANIYPAEVEAALIEHPAVIDAVVVGLPCDELGASVHAIIRLAGGISIEAIDGFVRARIAGYKCPESATR